MIGATTASVPSGVEPAAVPIVSEQDLNVSHEAGAEEAAPKKHKHKSKDKKDKKHKHKHKKDKAAGRDKHAEGGVDAAGASAPAADEATAPVTDAGAEDVAPVAPATTTAAGERTAPCPIGCDFSMNSVVSSVLLHQQLRAMTMACSASMSVARIETSSAFALHIA